MVHLAGRFYEHAAHAAATLGRRALLLVGRDEYAPRDLPRGVRAFAYAPYSLVLPRALATVHHGGIGSTGQALEPPLPCRPPWLLMSPSRFTRLARSLAPQARFVSGLSKSAATRTSHPSTGDRAVPNESCNKPRLITGFSY